MFGLVAVESAQVEMAAKVITSAEFQSQRPMAISSRAAGGAARNSQTRDRAAKSEVILTNSKRRYNFVASSRPSTLAGMISRQPAPIAPADAATPTKIEELGVTFWRLRPPKENEEDVPTFRVKLGEKMADWTAERVASSTRFKSGDRLRFTVESSRGGYLYIVNREVYKDGSTGDAEIIFPTLRTRGGDNHVAVGTLIEVPGSTDSVPYFTIASKRPDYAGEELIVLILPNELDGFEKSLRSQPVSTEQLKKWISDWGTTADIYDAEDGSGIALTKVEAEASAAASRSLTREEPLPQTIYRVSTAKNAPLFVSIKMSADLGK